MQFQKILSLRQIISIIAVTLFLLVCGSTILLLPITETGYFSSQINVDTPCHFTDLDYSLDKDNHLSFPNGGYLAPVLKDKEPLAVAIYGKGYVSSNNNQIETTECFLILPKNIYYSFMSQLYLQTSEENVYQEKSKSTIHNLLNIMPYVITPAGNKYFSFPSDYTAIMLLDGNSEANIITAANKYPIKSINFMLTGVGYIMLYLAVLGLILLLTNRYQGINDEGKSFVLKPSPKFFRFYLLLISSLWLVLGFVSNNAYINGLFLVITLAYAIYYLTVKRGIYPGYLRIQHHSLAKYLPLAVLLGLIFFILGAMSIPTQFKPIGLWLTNTLCFVWAPVLWICFLIFGYLLYELERYHSLSKSLGILFLLVLVVAFCLLLYNGVPLQVTLLNTLIFVPLYFLIISILVLRTNNVFIASTAIIISITLANAFINA